jgi:hypothetical protein
VAHAAVTAGWRTHSTLFQIAYARHDAASNQEGDWGLAHQSARLALDDLAFAAATSGKMRQAKDDFLRSRTEALREGNIEFADRALRDLAAVQLDLGKPADARETLKLLEGNSGSPAAGGTNPGTGGNSPGPGRNSTGAGGNAPGSGGSGPDAAGSSPGPSGSSLAETAFLHAELGDLAPAQRFIVTAENGDSAHDTIMVCCRLPLLRALLAVSAHKPAEAVELLEPARPYQLHDFEVPWLRAQAEAEAGMNAAAIADYRLILDNQGVDPLSPLYPLAHLRLARVLVLEKKPEEARAEYRAFLDAWKDADPALSLLADARHESAQLH